MSATNYVHLEGCDIVAVTDKAVLIEYEDEQHWIPISQLADGEDHSFERGDEDVTVSVSAWIAKQKGIDT